MKNTSETLRLYREFLENIPLSEYRDKFKDVKWVEQDLYPEMLPLGSVFRNYWANQRFLDFESWFKEFWQELHASSSSATALKNFMKYYFDKDNNGWFKLGFKARMYRTWVSVLTQLDFCYVFIYICDKNNISLKLECNSELDAQGIDARVGNIDFQVAKISQRKEARSVINRANKITIPYAVFDISEYIRLSQSSRVSTSNQGKYRNSVLAFNKYFVSLRNGFVVFNEYYVEQIIKNLNDVAKLRDKFDKMLKELSGE